MRYFMVGFMGFAKDESFDFGNFALPKNPDQTLEQDSLIERIKGETGLEIVRIVAISEFKNKKEFLEFYANKEFINKIK